jgi:hypothetical protein
LTVVSTANPGCDPKANGETNMAHRHEQLIPWNFYPGTTAYRIYSEAMTLAECGGIVETLDDPNLNIVAEILRQMTLKCDEACYLNNSSDEDYEVAATTLNLVWWIGRKNQDEALAANLFAEAGLSV